MKLKVSELEGRRLDFWVYRAMGWEYTGEAIPSSWKCNGKVALHKDGMTLCFDCAGKLFSTSWEDAGPIIQQAEIGIRPLSDGTWHATDYQQIEQHAYGAGPTPLIAAMRCFVALKFGDEVVTP